MAELQPTALPEAEELREPEVPERAERPEPEPEALEREGWARVVVPRFRPHLSTNANRAPSRRTIALRGTSTQALRSDIRRAAA